MVKKTEFFWNTVASVVTALLSAILLLFCTRINGTEIAGMFSICFATSVILNGIGDYGIRLFQVTDTNRKYKFGEYAGVRIVAVAIMTVIGLIFILINRYEMKKLLICLFLILFRVIDNLSETYQGEFQLQGRLDIGSKSVVIRNIIAVIVFLIVDLITKNVLISTIFLFIANMFLFILYDLRKIKKYTKETLNFNKVSLKELLKECFPVCISILLSLYITNAVKYAIDVHGNYNMQTYYNIIYLPTFTINLASLFILKPMLKVFGEYWNNNKIKELTKVIIIMILLIVIATLFIEIICMTIGIPILNFIYNVELKEYKVELFILVLSGCFYAIASLMLYVSTTIRKQRQATIAYGVCCILAIILTNILVKNMAMLGGAISNLVITIILSMLLSLIYVKEIYNKYIKIKNAK